MNNPCHSIVLRLVNITKTDVRNFELKRFLIKIPINSSHWFSLCIPPSISLSSPYTCRANFEPNLSWTFKTLLCESRNSDRLLSFYPSFSFLSLQFHHHHTICSLFSLLAMAKYASVMDKPQRREKSHRVDLKIYAADFSPTRNQITDSNPAKDILLFASFFLGCRF